ncbi:MAG: bifunctional folylpolyglutamate synthase/dihydrofolate synthase [Clostridia bacterium]|nr:bifunctional folylpolyglutamate synthase/dihydrofolate synthase [Clostridia bacterium]
MDIIKFANSFQTTSVLELDNIKRLMARLSNPEKDLKYIHVAGTNGKGSVCAFLQSILTESGLKCGKFTSPFLLHPEERIEIDGTPITTEEFNRILTKIGEFADGQSQFELLVAVAICYFKQEKCDIVIMECGMGRIGDATNIIPAPECAVITKIGLDHTEYLGNTVEEITKNKCGIIKVGTKHTITLPQPTDGIIKELSEGEFHFSEPCGYPLSLKGKHQKQNAGLAVSVCRALGISEEHIKSGLLKARHIGRFEEFDVTPKIIFDGAHNPDGAKALAESLPEGDLTLICAFMADKDIDGVFKEFTDKNIHKRSIMYCTTVKDNPRAMTSEKLTELAKKHGFNAFPCPDISDALRKRKTQTLVFGSLYLYKDFIEALKGAVSIIQTYV